MTAHLALLHRALVLIRSACWAGDVSKAEAIADAVHNLPLVLADPSRLASFPAEFLKPLFARYPELQELRELLPKGQPERTSLHMEKTIAGTEKVKRVLGGWAPNDLAYIECLDLRGHDHGGSLTIAALFQRRALNNPWPNVKGPMRRVTLCFQEVRELHLTGFGGAWVQIMGFDIIPMADRGWENVRFQIEDYEDGRIGFYCRSVDVVAVEDGDYYLP